MQTLTFEGLKIGPQFEPIVIPEIGINHGGSIDVAFAMVDAAHRAGAKIIKHQTHVIDDEMSSQAKLVIPGNSSKSIYHVMEECALSELDERRLCDYIRSKNMVFLSTPFSRAAAKRLERFGVSAYKIGSGEMNNHPLIDFVAQIGRPMIISTGMNDLCAINKTVAIIKKHKCSFALLHTTNLYPTHPSQVRLGAMTSLKCFGVPFGLSDHTQNNNACIAAIALGASIVERHFTDSKSRVGNDICCSMDEHELKNLLISAHEVFQMRGGKKFALPEEKVTIDFAFATVVAITDIEAGETLSLNNVWVKRPGTGEISAELFNALLGKVARVSITKDTHLSWEMIEQ